MSVFQRTVRLVTFDVTNTLLKFRIPPAEFYLQTAERKVGFRLSAEDLSKRFSANYSEMNKKYPNFGRGSEIATWEEWWRYVVRSTLIPSIPDKDTVEIIATELIESYKMKENWTLNCGCLEVLEYLKDMKINLGVISNFDPRLHEILKNTGVIKYFDFILPSYEAGYAKPDTELFLKALLIPREKIMPMQALHIGDNVKLDYLAAKKSGWQGAIIGNNKKGKHLEDDSVNKEHIFNNLNDLILCFMQHEKLFEH